MIALFRGQPRPFYMIFMLEIWERFGFYTVQGILILYFIRFLGFTHEMAYQTFGAFFALVYGWVAVGGYLGDQILGTKRTILLGLTILMVGYASLGFLDKQNIYLALALISVGNGIFKANPPSLLSKCYAAQNQEKSLLQAGFTMYYMAINLGAIFAFFVGPVVANHYGYTYTFFISAFGILLGLLNYAFQHQSIASLNNQADQRPLSGLKILLIACTALFMIVLSTFLLQHVATTQHLLMLVTSVLLLIYIYHMYQEPLTAKKHMLLALFLMLEAVVFYTLYQQMPTSINLFAVKNVHPHLFGFDIDPQSFQVFNPFWIIFMSPIIAQIYAYFQQKNQKLPIPHKFALGMSFCGISFLVLYLSRYFHDVNGMVSPWWLIISYWFQSISEILISALGIAMVAELIPERILGFVMGMWYLTSAIAGFTGAKIASLTALPTDVPSGLTSLTLYTNVFACIGFVVLAIGILLWFLSPYLERLGET